jgi:predicted O-methyltransferase YrrM
LVWRFNSGPCGARAGTAPSIPLLAAERAQESATMVEPSLRAYAEDIFGGEDELLRQMREEAEAQGLPSIQVPLETGRLLAFLITLCGARQVLEIGTLFGYSTVTMARALPSDGRVISLEVNERHAAIARENLHRAGLEGRVEVRQGPALELLQSLQDGSFDLVFIDADKETYPRYLEEAVRLSHPGSVIVADNVWYHGAVVHPEDERVASIDAFNRAMARHPRLLSIIAPNHLCSDGASVSVVRGG